MPPTFLWVSKFVVKLGSWVMIFKVTLCMCAFFCPKSKVPLPRRENDKFMNSYDTAVGGGVVARTNVAEDSTKPTHSPYGVQRKFTKRARSPSLRM